MALCRHCNKGKAVKHKKGLCWSCAQIPEVRAKYASSSKYGRPSPSLLEPTMDCQPTTALPGTAEKIAVMMARAEQGQHIFHQDDPVIKHESYLRTGGEARLNSAFVDPEQLQGCKVSTILERAFTFPKERPGS